MFRRMAFPFTYRLELQRVTAERLGVTVEHLLAVIAARKAYRQARFYRRRARQRMLEKNPKAERRVGAFGRQVTYAGEGELHPLLRESGLTKKQFLELAGISADTFNGWYGHPLHRMPIALLEHYIWATNMAQALRARGIDVDQFRAKGLPRTTAGNYPRGGAQTEQLRQHVKAIANAAQVNCPVHGLQQAMGGECPKC